MGLPVLRLPILPFDIVYKFLGVSDKIPLSQCSKTMKAVVMSKEGSKEGWELYINIKENFISSISMRKKSENLTTFTWCLETDNEVISDNGVVKTMKEGGRVEWKSLVKEEFYVEELLAIFKILKETFTCSIRSVSYFSDRSTFRRLFMETNVFHLANSISIYKEDTYEPEELNFMFDNFVVGYLDIWADCVPGYRYPKPLDYCTLYLKYARWINLEMLLEMVKNSACIALEAVNLITDKDINQFIKSWIRSDNKKLEILFIEREHNNIDIDVIMEGIESTPGRKKRKDAMPLCMHYIDDCYVDGLDIRRTDGVEATVMVEATWFALGVMQLPNPNLEEGEVEDDEQEDLNNNDN